MNNWKEKLIALKIKQSITFDYPADRRSVFNAASSLKKETQGKFNYMVRKNVIWRIK